jgi:hypothetical protein
MSLEIPTVVARGMPVWVTLSIVNDTQQPIVLGAPEAIGAELEWNQLGGTSQPRQDVPLFLQPGHALELEFRTDPPASVATSQSATLRVHLNGSAQLQGVQTVEFADLATSAQPSGLSAAFEHVLVPTVVGTDSQIPIEVIARNSSQVVWLPELTADPTPAGRVGVSVRHWIAPDGQRLEPMGNHTQHLDWYVNPGQTALFTFSTPAPHIPGQYRLVLDMLSESVTWFEDVHGGAQTSLSVNVVS